MSKKNRSGGLLAVVLAVTVVGVVLALPKGGPERTPVEVTVTGDVPQKPGVPYLIVRSGDPVPNIEPPMELHIADVTKDECDHMGGKYQAHNRICLDVDY